MSGYYCEYPPEFYSERCSVARKPHKCCETGRTIQPGERYWKCSGKWDGDFQTYTQSDGAYHFARWMNGVGPGGAWIGGRHADPDGCIPFGGIGGAVIDADDEELTAEWERVKRGEVTRDTTTLAPVDGNG